MQDSVLGSPLELGGLNGFGWCSLSQWWSKTCWGRFIFPCVPLAASRRWARGLPAGTWVLGMGTPGRKCRGQILAVLFYVKNNLGSRHIALIQLLMKSEGGFGGSWCEHLVQTRKTEEVGVKTSAQGEVGFGLFKMRGLCKKFLLTLWLKISENKVSHREISGSLILLFLLWVVLTSHMPHCSGWTNRALRLRAGTCAQAPLSCVELRLRSWALSLKSSHPETAS